MRSAFLCILTTLFISGIAMANWSAIYECDQLPENSDPKWNSEWDNNEVNGPQGKIIADPDNAGNKLYYIKDVAGAKTARDLPLDVDLNAGLTIVLRMKCTTGGHPESLNIGWFDKGFSGVECVLWTDHFQYGTSNAVITEEFKVDGTQWHVYRITAKGNDATIYLDENPKPQIDSKTVVGVSTIPSDSIYIGSHSTGGAQEIYYDYILIDLSGTYPPGKGTPIPGHLIGSSPVEPAGKLSKTWGLIKNMY